MSELLLLHVVNGVGLVGVVLVWLVMALRLRRGSYSLGAGVIVMGFLQLVSGFLLAGMGGSVVHVCVAGVAMVIFVVVVEGVVRVSGHGRLARPITRGD